MSLATDVRAEIGAKLVEEVAKVAEIARSNASWSSTIPKAIILGKLEIQDKYTAMSIILDTINYPEAGAFEFGSGEHRETNPGKYRIPSEGHEGILAFEWEKMPSGPGPKFIGVAKDGKKLLFRFVEHPGVAADPFMLPAIDKQLPGMGERIGSSTLRVIVHRLNSILIGFET